jgi:hypothetical protein
MYIYTYKRTIRALAEEDARTRSQTRTHTHTHSHTHTHTHTHTHGHSHSYSHTRTLACTLTLILSHKHIHVHTRARAHTHTHTNTTHLCSICAPVALCRACCGRYSFALGSLWNISLLQCALPHTATIEHIKCHLGWSADFQTDRHTAENQTRSSQTDTYTPTCLNSRIFSMMHVPKIHPHTHTWVHMCMIPACT